MTLNWSKWLTRLVGSVTGALFLLNTIVTSAALAASDAERAAEIGTRMKTAMTAIEDGQREAARDRWDPAYIILKVGVEPQALYEWVRSNVVWAPYLGALRGPVGVLMDRKGNSLDQALLLAELLKSSGRTVRLAHATLAPDVASAALQRLVAGRSAGATLEGPLAPQMAEGSAKLFVNGSGVLDTADAYGIDPIALTEKLESSATRANAVATEIAARMRDQSRALWPALSTQSAEAASKDVMDKALIAIGDHWWVQMNKDGQWVDFDLLSASGATLASATQTADPGALAETLEHKITVRLVIGQWKDGKTSDAVALEQSFRPRDLIGKHVKLTHVPSLWPSDWPDVTEDDIQIKLRAALYTQKEWLPVLTVDGKQFMRASIMDTGVVNESPNSGDPFRRMTVPAVGQIVKATDILATIGDPDEKPETDPKLSDPKTPRAEGELVGEWLEFEFQAPGEAPRKIRREIFDIIGPAARASNAPPAFTMSDEKKIARSMAALGETEMLIMPNALSSAYLLHLTAENALQNKGLIDDIAGDPFGKAPANVVEVFSKMTDFPAALYGFAAMRFDANPHADQLFVDRPQVILQHSTLSRGKGGDFHTSRALDIVYNSIGVDPASARFAQQHRLLQGIIDTNTEAETLRITGQTVTENTGDAFSAALKAGREWTLLRPGDDAKLAALKASPDLMARMRDDLKAGQIVVASAQGENTGWWRIDPATGTTLGMGTNGTGAAMVEYALVVVIQTIISTAQCLFAKAATRAIEKTLEEVDKGKGYIASAGEGLKAGKSQGQESFRESRSTNHRHCAALGLMGGFDAGLMMATFDLARYFAKMELPVSPGGGGEPGSGKPRPESDGSGKEMKTPEGKSPEEKPLPEGSSEKLPEERKPDADKGREPEKGDRGGDPESKKNPEQSEKTKDDGEPEKGKPGDADRFKSQEEANKNADEAERKARDAKEKYDKNPTPENKKAFEDAAKDAEQARIDQTRWNARHGAPGTDARGNPVHPSPETVTAEQAANDAKKKAEDLGRRAARTEDPRDEAAAQKAWDDYHKADDKLQDARKADMDRGAPDAPLSKTADGGQGAAVDPFGKTGEAPAAELPAPKSEALDKTINDKKLTDDYPQGADRKYTPEEIEQNIRQEKELRGKLDKANKKLEDIEKKADADPSPQNEADLKRARQETEDLKSQYGAAEKEVGEGLLQQGNSRADIDKWVDMRSGGASSGGASDLSGGGTPPPAPSSPPPKETLAGLGEMANAFGSLPPP